MGMIELEVDKDLSSERIVVHASNAGPSRPRAGRPPPGPALAGLDG
jgi:hypothetical protein